MSGKKIPRHSAFRWFEDIPYCAALLFPEGDGLWAPGPPEPFRADRIWDFDDGTLTGHFFWDRETAACFDRAVGPDRVRALLAAGGSFLEPETAALLADELERSLARGVFAARKAEFLEKMRRPSAAERHWGAETKGGPYGEL